MSERDEGYPEMGDRSLVRGDRGRLLVVHTVMGLYDIGLNTSGITGTGRVFKTYGEINTAIKGEMQLH